MEFRIVALSLLVLSLVPGTPAEGQQKPPDRIWVTGYYFDSKDRPLPPAEIEYASLTHIVHHSIDPSIDDAHAGSWWKKPRDFEKPQADLIRLAHAAGVKVLLGLGGTDYAGPKGGNAAYRVITKDPKMLAEYVAGVIGYAKSKGYDGVDVDWEAPKPGEEKQCAALLTSLRTALNEWNPKTLLTIAVPAYPSAWWGFDVPSLNQCANQVNLMSYNLDFGKFTSLACPLVKPTAWPEYDGSTAERCIDGWITKGLTASKIGLGVGFYADTYYDTDAPGQRRIGKPNDGKWSISYADLRKRITPATYHWDDVGKAPWLGGVDAKGRKFFIPFEDEKSLALKVPYLRSKGIGGLMIWELGSGYLPSEPAGERHPLLTAIRKAAGRLLRRK